MTISGAQTIEGDKTFGAGTLTTFLGNVFFDGIDITMSGTTLTTQSGAVFNYDSTSTINNAGDTNYLSTSTTTHESGSVDTYEAGSIVTFSGTTTFETETYFNSDIVMASGTQITIGDLVITGTISGSFTDTNRRFGQELVVNGSTSQAVLFKANFPDDSYTLVATLTNEVDSPPSIYSTIQGVKTATGFTTYFSGVIDSSNFVLEWIAFHGEQE